MIGIDNKYCVLSFYVPGMPNALSVLIVLNLQFCEMYYYCSYFLDAKTEVHNV